MNLKSYFTGSIPSQFSSMIDIVGCSVQKDVCTGSSVSVFLFMFTRFLCSLYTFHSVCDYTKHVMLYNRLSISVSEVIS